EELEAPLPGLALADDPGRAYERIRALLQREAHAQLLADLEVLRGLDEHAGHAQVAGGDAAHVPFPARVDVDVHALAHGTARGHVQETDEALVPVGSGRQTQDLDAAAEDLVGERVLPVPPRENGHGDVPGQGLAADLAHEIARPGQLRVHEQHVHGQVPRGTQRVLPVVRVVA